MSENYRDKLREKPFRDTPSEWAYGDRWYEAINDIGIFLDCWGRTAERLGWTARDIIGPQFTPRALAWALKGARVVSLTRTTACLSDSRIFIRAGQEVCDDHL